MKKYDVYGIGNALMDMEFSVSVELLQEMKIEKGIMTLMDENQQQEIMTRLGNIPEKKSSGGSAANTMVALSQLGGKAFYSCKVANDQTGDLYLKDLVDCGVEINKNQGELSAGITGKCLVMVTPDADRTMGTFLGITGKLSEAELVPEAIKNSEYLYIEGYLVSSPTAIKAAITAREIAKKAGGKIAFSLSDLSMVEYFKPGILEIIGEGIDFIFANEIEALKLAETEKIEVAVEHLKTLTSCFAITLGAKGSLIFDGTEIIEIPPVTVKAIDTVGAGDMYAGAFLYGITHGMSYSAAGNLASQAAAKIVTSYGPRLATAELKSLLN